MTILTVGGATQDIFFLCQESTYSMPCNNRLQENYLIFEPGDKIEIEKLFYQSGGGATNSAASFKKLGFKTACCATLGNDHFAAIIMKELNDLAIDTSLMQTTEKDHTALSFIIKKENQEQVICAFRGANCYLSAAKIPSSFLATCSLLYITSLSKQASQELEILTQAAQRVKVPIVINPGKSQLDTGALILKETLSRINTIIMNKSEAELFMRSLICQDGALREVLERSNGEKNCPEMISDRVPYLLESTITVNKENFSIKSFFKQILSWGPQTVVVTHGCNGVYVATKEKCFFHPSIPVTLVSSVGAGDAFGSTFIASLQNGYSLENAIRFGVINSASVLTHLGAKSGLLSFEHLEQKASMLSADLLQEFFLS